MQNEPSNKGTKFVTALWASTGQPNLFRLALVILSVASVNLYAEDLGIPFIVKDACPFEGCTFGEWEVLGDTNVYQSPNKNSPIIGKLERGTKAHVLTGMEYVNPGEAKLTGKPYSHAEQFDPSKKIYILNYLGEGYSQIFHNGNFMDTRIARKKTRCSENPNWRYCWVELLREPSSDWWVMVKDMGWVLIEPHSLSPIDPFSYQAPYNNELQATHFVRA
jgi:hypothetical protein